MSTVDQDITDKLKRSETGDLLFIGDLLDQHLKRTGILRMIEYLVQDKVMEELILNKHEVNSDRVRGRLEMGASLLMDLKNYIAQKDDLKRPIKRKRRGKLSAVAEEPEVPNEMGSQYGGQV